MSRRRPSRQSPPPKGANAALARALGQYVRSARMVAHYDVLRREAAENRREPEIRYDATYTEQCYNAQRRIRAIAIADELCANSGIGATVETAIRMAIGTKGGSPVFDESDGLAAARFRHWKRDCGYAMGEQYQEVLSCILRTVLVHGDCLVVCGEATDWRIRLFDADQICNVSDFPAWRLANNLADDVRQVEGVCVDGTGRVVGYNITMERNRAAVANADAAFIPFGAGRHVMLPRYISQYRGMSPVLCNAELSDETKNLLKSEVGAARLNSELALAVIQPSGGDDIGNLLDGFENNGTAVADGSTITEQQVAALAEASAAAASGDTFKVFAGRAAIANLPSGSTIQSLNNANRPSQPIQQWINTLEDANAKQLGLCSIFGRAKNDASYSGGQMEIALSWAAIEDYQKMLERQVVDYVVPLVCPGVEYTVAWREAFEVDPEKAEKTKDARLRGGRTTLRELIGPTWRAKIEELAEEKRVMEDLGLTNLSFFQTAAGNEISPAEADIPEQGMEEEA